MVRAGRRKVSAGGVLYEDHYCIAVYRIGKVGAHGILGDEVHVSAEAFSELVLDPDNFKEALFAGKPLRRNWTGALRRGLRNTARELQKQSLSWRSE